MVTFSASSALQQRSQLLGEHHVAGIADTDLIDGCIAWIGSEPEDTREKRRRDLLTLLVRATRPEHGEDTANRARWLRFAREER